MCRHRCQGCARGWVTRKSGREQSLDSSAHFKANGNGSSTPVAPGSASANGSCLASSSTGVWSEHSASTAPSASAARSASRSRWLKGGVKWQLNQSNRCPFQRCMMDGYIQKFSGHLFGLPHHVDLPYLTAAQMNARAGSRASNSMVVAQRSRRTPESQRGRAVAIWPSCAKPRAPTRILRSQPYRKIERAHTAARAAAVACRERCVGMRERDAASVHELRISVRCVPLRPTVRAPTG